MADSFFLGGGGGGAAKRRRPGMTATASKMQRGAGSGGRGRGRGGGGRGGGGRGGGASSGGGGSRRDADEDGDAEDEIVGFGDLDDDEGPAGSEDEEGGADPLDRETAAEKRVRLAKQYLDVLARPADGDDDADDEDGDGRALVAARLMQDGLAAAGKLQVHVANQLPAVIDASGATSFRGHELSVTAAVVSDDEHFVYSAGKEGWIIKWNLALQRKEWVLKAILKNAPGSFQGHTDQVLALAITSDGKFLASGGRDFSIRIWDAATGAHVHVFRQHRGAVKGLAFRRGTYQLYSASDDRTVKVWEVGEMAYVETLFGHQEGVTAIDALSRERCITSGGRDRSARLWKVAEESQLLYKGQAASMDTVRWVSDDAFVSGDDEGNLCLWDVNKKKATVTIPHAHGPGRWICAVAALAHTDLVASGASDGEIRFWKVGDTRRTLVPVATCSVAGFINALAFSASGKLLIVGVGQEHRFGRWERLPAARNGVRVIALPINREKASRNALPAFKPVPASAPVPAAAPAAPPASKKDSKHAGTKSRGGSGGKRPTGRGPRARADAQRR